MEKGSRPREPGAEIRLPPAMAQYQEIKSKYPDAILLFHIGDFYETFNEDAETVSRELDIVLTSRSRDRSGNRIPLAGVPCHAVEGYIARLIAKGYKVAVCDQVEDARAAKGVVKREVVRVVTPGMVMDETLIPSPDAHYLLAISPDAKKGQAGLAFLDITTGEFSVVNVALEHGYSALLGEIARNAPAECLLPDDAPPELAEFLSRNGLVVSRAAAGTFLPEKGRDALCRHFGVASLEGFGIARNSPEEQAAGAALLYAQETQRSELAQISTLSVRNSGESCLLDAVTLRNLEIVQGIRGRGKEGTLLSVLDRTATPMGGRLLRQWLCEPLVNVTAINARLDGVEYFVRNTATRMEASRALRRCADLGRIAGRIAFGNATPRDLKSLERSLAAIPQLKTILGCGQGSDVPAFIRDACGMLSDLSWVGETIGAAIVDDPPAAVRNGGVIRDGFSPELDSLRRISTSGREWILELQQRERERTGIKSLKVAYNSVFGYYIEVTRPNLSLVPPEYQRKQTTSTGERFTIPELKEKEAVISSAEERQLSLEQEVYSGLLERLNEAVPLIKEISRGIALLDVAVSLAEAAESGHYCRPVIDESTHLLVREGRHPVVEVGMPGKFVPNDLELSSERDQILIVTGANMAGKSTYMRAAALVAIMAQAGSFVPAAYARVGVVDRVFTRVGAFDDLASGQSTFLVEMIELANILNNVTVRSLVILDEIGRGTSTLDGLSIARAVLEFLHGKKSRGPRTLFATHFHELVTFEGEFSRVKNFHFAAKDTGKEVVFLRKIIPGATDKSYGIHVATLAGVPRRVTDRAREILEEISDAKNPSTGERVKRYTQMLLPDIPAVDAPSHPVIEMLKNLNLDDMTPLSGLSLLYDLQKRARDGER
ncbi:MAG TPA: DNA mismatch repair protein MutS [Methanolinea sp.]|nr:DNA mismatch repair protein MutS [Methanolinea sp.]HQK55249.1 DNA mismatch repair protein MutS [Methanolinea sp.]